MGVVLVGVVSLGVVRVGVVLCGKKSTCGDVIRRTVQVENQIS